MSVSAQLNINSTKKQEGYFGSPHAYRHSRWRY